MADTFISPVVTVLGHVDHGKTTLLDAIRKSNIATGEHGGITQKIGATSVTVLYEGNKREITLIDTPGHEAFMAMRSRGSQVADIGLLIVSLVDGVMPQTKESITLLKHARIPFIVVLTKADSPDKNPEKIKQELIREDVLLEGYGGNIPVIEVSARTGDKIKELLDLILLVVSMNVSSATATDSLKAIVIESKLDPKAGARATVVVKAGTLSVKDDIQTDGIEAKVRSITKATGESVRSISVGQAGEVLGFTAVPAVGSIITRKGEGILKETSFEHKPTHEKRTKNDGKTLSLVLVADTVGSLEAIIASLPKEVYIMESKTGEVSIADVLFAKSTGSVILSFNSKLRPEVVKQALLEKILLKNYTLIYEMLDEIQQVIDGKALSLLEQIYGVAKIQATFPFDKTTVLGVTILDGRVARGDKVRIIRGSDEIIGESSIVSVRQGKDTVTKVEKGSEAGIIIAPLLDITIGDMIVCHS